MARRRYVVRNGEVVEWTPPEPEAGLTVIRTDHYDGMTTIDGVDISSRAKRKAYMAAEGVVESSDYSPEYRAKARASIQREAQKKRKADLVSSYQQLLHTRRR